MLITAGDPWWLRSLESVLSGGGYPVATAETGRRAIELRRHLEPGALLIQPELPDMGGIDLLLSLRAEPGFDPTVPVLLLFREPQQREVRLRALQAGAWDCLSWPLDAEECLARLGVYTAAARAAAQARAVALFDGPDQVLSRQALLVATSHVYALARRTGRPVGFVVLSVVEAEPREGPEPAEIHQRRVHATRRLAHLLEVTIRLSDPVGLLSPTEIGILAPDVGVEGCMRLVDRVLSVADSVGTPMLVGSGPESFRVVAGIYAPADPRDAGEAVALLRRAHQAEKSIEHWDSGRRVAVYGVTVPEPGV